MGNFFGSHTGQVGGHTSLVQDNFDRPANTTQYAAGERVTVTAVPAEGKEFWYWRVDLTGKENPVEILMDRHKHLVAVFRAVS